MNRSSIRVAQILVLTLLSGASFAGSLDFGISPTASFAVGQREQKPAVGVDARLFYHLNDHWAVGTNAAYTYQSDDKVTLISVTPGVQLGTTFSLAVLSIRPYVSGGVGYYRTKYGDLPQNLSQTSHSVDNVGANAGGGFAIALPGFVIGADVRYERIFESGTDREFVRPSLTLSIPFF